MYETFYGFTARPFQLMPDPRLLFESRDHVRALSYLLYGLERGEGFVVITGDVGTGKTLLLQSLLLELSNRDLAVARVAMANLGADSVVPAVVAAFGLPYTGRGKLELLDALIGRLQARSGQGALLIVDEAQACSVEALEELRALANLQAEGRALMQVALIGQTELRDLLATPNMSHLRQRIVAAHHLQPLAIDEIRGYIEHRLERVGWTRDPHIDPEIYPRVHDASGGVPRRINMLMDRLLLYGYIEALHELGITELNTVTEEFEQEIGAHSLLWSGGQDATTDGSGRAEAVDPGRLDTLADRLGQMEQALRRAVGGQRMEQLLARHRIDAESRAVVDTELRLKRLEGVFADLETQLRRGEGAPQTTAAGEAVPRSARPAPGADFIDEIRPGTGRDAARVPSATEEHDLFDPRELWADGADKQPSRLFFWRRRHGNE